MTTYFVYDPEIVGEDDVEVWLADDFVSEHTVDADSVEQAAEQYAENDVDGQRVGVYTDGGTLRVRDVDAGVTYECTVVVHYVSSYVASSTSRK